MNNTLLAFWIRKMTDDMVVAMKAKSKPAVDRGLLQDGEIVNNIITTIISLITLFCTLLQKFGCD